MRPTSTVSSDELEDLSASVDLPSLAKRFLTAFRNNDLEQLLQLNSQLDPLLGDDENFSSLKGFISQDHPAALPLFLHNVHIASSLASTALLAIEGVSHEFDQKLKLFNQSPPSTTPSLPVPPSQHLSSASTTCSSDACLPLKCWSLLHMSYLFPSKKQIEELASQTSMTSNQITFWFRNARTRSGWSKLYAHPNVQKEQLRLEGFLKEYDTLKRHSSDEGFQSFLARNELLQLLDKVLQWFATTKHPKPPKSDSVKPWIKEVVNNALATLKDKTTGVIDSSRQLLPSLPSRKRARTKKTTPSPSPLSQSTSPVISSFTTPILLSESPRSSLSRPSTAGSFSNPGSIPMPDFRSYRSPLTNDSLNSCDPSPGSSSTMPSDAMDFPLVSLSPPKNFSSSCSISYLNFILETPELPLDPNVVPMLPSNQDLNPNPILPPSEDLNLVPTLSSNQDLNLVPTLSSNQDLNLVPTLPSNPEVSGFNFSSLDLPSLPNPLLSFDLAPTEPNPSNVSNTLSSTFLSTIVPTTADPDQSTQSLTEPILSNVSNNFSSTFSSTVASSTFELAHSPLPDRFEDAEED